MRRKLRRSPEGAPPEPTSLPGYRVGPPLGFGARGALWSATALGGAAVAEGRRCAVSFLDPGADAAAVRARFEALVGNRHQGVGEVLELVAGPRGAAVVSERVEGPTLAVVRASRAGLELGEATTVLSRLADALAFLHSLGLAHGDVSPANVLLANGNRPVLVDLMGEATGEAGTRGFRPPERERGGPASPAGDVWSLATLAAWLVGETDRAEVERHLEAALADEPGRRPAAADLGDLARDLAEPVEVRVPAAAAMAQGSLRARAALDETRIIARRGPLGRLRFRRASRAGPRAQVSEGSGSTSGRFRGSPGLRTWVVALGVGVGLGAGAAWVVPQPGADPAPAELGALGAPGAGVAVESTAGAGALIEARDVALNSGDASALAALTVTGSPAAERDEALLGALAAGGASVSGLATQVESLAFLGERGGQVRVEALTRQSEHRLLRVGMPAEVVPARPARCSILVLTRSPVAEEGWRDPSKRGPASDALTLADPGAGPAWRVWDVEGCDAGVS